jgi:Mlc titration factor MtfA (ptsG expression regulator)
MATPLSTCTVKSNEALFLFLWSEGVKPSEIYRRIKVQFGDSCLIQGRVYEWVDGFQNERQNVSDEHWSGRPVSVATETVKQQIEQRIHDYRRVTIHEIAVELNMLNGSAYNIVHYDLGHRKACSRWVPKQLSDDHKHAQ